MRRVSLLLLVTLLIFTLAGCGGTAVENDGKIDSNSVQSVEGVMGQYVGQIDSNSVEIIIDGEPKALEPTA
nr:hypothetical protein [Desulforamulus aquiferis]